MGFEVETTAATDVTDVTDRVAARVPEGHDGTVTVFCRHTTASVVVNESERRLLADIESFLEAVVPDDGWRHDEIDDNADGHLRALLLGPSITVPVTDGTLDLGRWQAVLLVECDGPRTRTIEVRA